ncbi:hypothetical protein L5F68_05360 [Aliarcobacter butzleri]|uniref:hypothetical protein n=1 Tax=Aliarcobacter butzleri TaxID=28197 RepID=UPI001EDBA2F2|nr:hypothetical protein [Aliarcobacter butzleri]MCG3667488.1 hypothetical protein [Aliarcobacter butzleri]MCG3703759.1 hypothetical protein [Aliarcobacter butzleri]MDN5112938.1 hypothetical protein [Aliarcobacter butzleri]
MKYIVFSFLFTLIFAGCTTTNKSVQITAEETNKKLFENKENWQPINKDNTLQNIKNDKVVK